MGRLPEQLVGGLPGDAIRTGVAAERIERRGGGWVVHTAGGSVRAPRVVIATDGDAGRALLEGHAAVEALPVTWRSCATIAYACETPLTDDPILVLDGQGEGPVNHLAAMSVVSPSYAPAGRHLVYANVVDPGALEAAPDDAALEAACRPQLMRWFGDKMDGATMIHVDRIVRGLPDQSPRYLETPRRPVRYGEGLFACGDWLDNASIDGALASGKRCAEALLGDTPV